ncbi:acid protease [Hypoxylon sp. NC1633]|nr:acid protease [Hypoxylon sp. NC1633]
MTLRDTSPFQLPVRDVQVVPDIPDSFMRGIAATIGTPPQNIVLLPWPDLNNTWIYDSQAYCDSSIIWNDVICQVRRGNYYHENNSSTWMKADDIAAAGGAIIETESHGSELGVGKLIDSSLGGIDTLSFGPAKNLTDVAVGIPRLSWDHGYTILHAMGMGSNSTILNALLETGQIGSRVWSIFWGRMWLDNESVVDGSIVFGGFDQQKIIGRNYTQPLDFSNDTGCWTGMKVHISKIQLNVRTGEDVDLLETGIDACIVPQRQNLLAAPGSVTDAFELATGMISHDISYGLHWSSRLYDVVNTTDSDLTISLSTGLDVRIPNNQYLVPHVDIDRNGSRIFNTSEKELLINLAGDQPGTLGRYFLTAAYLMVDLDSHTFTLWQANPTADSELVPVVGTRLECGNGTSSPSSGTEPPDPSSITETTSGLSGGSIAGIVIGTVAGLAILVLGILFVLRQREIGGHVSQVSELSSNDTKKLHSPVHGLRRSPRVLSELSGQDHYTYELDGTTNMVRT